MAPVWYYEGLWCKVFPGRVDQRAIIADIPCLPGRAVTPLMGSIGIVEAAVGIWALSGKRPCLAAVVQTWLIVSFNAGGLIFAAGRFHEPGRLIITDLALIALIRLVAERRATTR
ncbi:DoxX-like family protein [Streptomyces sp. ICBB 8177]|uniref:DoxX-like family protein n=1 Tax=Streptomyces sp. ICBB 8177 TaxID=563922 RepID=UPI001305385E|nr:DoxX-like family protein [Streptomyces sp. ICBB 8177]